MTNFGSVLKMLVTGLATGHGVRAKAGSRVTPRLLCGTTERAIIKTGRDGFRREGPELSFRGVEFELRAHDTYIMSFVPPVGSMRQGYYQLHFIGVETEALAQGHMASK